MSVGSYDADGRRQSDVPGLSGLTSLCVSAVAPPLPDEWKGEEFSYCCAGAAMTGDPTHCTCWEPMYDQEQAPPIESSIDKVRDERCIDCAYRAGSPEWEDEDEHEKLLDLTHGGQPFWCHQGMRRPVGYRHPDGRVIDGLPDDYRPPIVEGRPYKADGTVGDVCAGWALMHEKAAQ